ncbi:hypothetical protein DFJ67_4505 [Asanoa ferruginea]|uniref:Uncharacterized protein n=1 Tax=Asanoa ferruginea TaxID=53367 RepID=A0A3D9ZMP9_9ACTN|nr:hypothetical protein [Asanoa ferruginea]REF98487.1 hypothetical protein DFJ67_4505 [Asanoa ferruginea]GIF52854.1 hypothetical protein Afe04nite_73930 [Asanoa ferruginea]
MSHDALEARYRRLLWAYPKRYRHERGAEMIGTLLEAAGPDQRRPTAREATILVLRGLQTRAGTHSAPAAGRGARGALRLAVLLLLAYAGAGSLAESGRVIPRMISQGVDYPSELIHPLVTVTCALALLAVAGGRYLLGLLATLGALAGTLVVTYFSLVGVDVVTGERYYPAIISVRDFVAGESTIWPMPLAALLLLPLLIRPAPGSRRPAFWLLAVPAAVVLLPTDYDTTTGLQPWATVAVLAGALLWVAVDARATIAAGVLLLPVILAWLWLSQFGAWDQPGSDASLWFWTVLSGALALLTAGTLRLRRQARV